VKVRNLGVAANIMTVSSAGAGNVPSGTGTALIPGGASDVVPVASRQFTIYGTAGDRVSFQAYTTAAQPVAA
jgi:hypothetical protein